MAVAFSRRRGVQSLVCAVAAWGLAAGLAQAGTPAGLWHGGTIITMDGDQPHTVGAVVVRDGMITYVGDEAGARNVAGPDALDHDLHGATMLPGFFDAHSHFAVALQSAGGLDLAEAGVHDVAGALAAIRGFIAQRKLPEGSWVSVWQYSEADLAEHRHITRAELDAAFPGYKVVLVHFTLHGMVLNSAALAAVHISEDTPVPEGGIMPKGPDGRLTGVLFEKAMLMAAMRLPQPTAAEKLAALDAAQMRYARNGFTHAQEGATQLPDLQFLLSAPARERLRIDLGALPFFTTIDWLGQHPELKFGTYDGHFKLQGVKFILDGSPQARTAYFTRDYAQGAPDGHHPWHGNPVTREEDFLAMARKVHERGVQIFVHANGDAAIDEAIRTFDALGIRAADDRRPIIIHSQFQRPDQLPAYVRIGVGPSYFTNHTYYFADIHRSNFPPEVVDFISPMQSARRAGLITSNHSDFPVTALDPFTQIWSSMARTSLSGVVSGAGERLSAYEALQAMTTGPAWQAHDENRAGRLKVGLLGDLVVLDRNPLQVPVDQIRSIHVLETIKQGETIYRRP